MRFMILVPANPTSEAGTLPDPKMLTEMGKYNEALVNAGVMLSGDGLHASSKGARVTFEGSKPPVVIDGPFTESKELIAGFWIFKVGSKQEAIDWVKRAPFGTFGNDRTVVEIRQIFDPEDFAPVDPTGEIRQKEAALRAMGEKQHT